MVNSDSPHVGFPEGLANQDSRSNLAWGGRGVVIVRMTICHPHYFYLTSIRANAASTDVWSDRNCSNLTSLTVWVTRAFVTSWTVPSTPVAFLTSWTSAPSPELSTKSILDRSRIRFLGPSSTHLSITFLKVGSENASSSPVRRNNW